MQAVSLIEKEMLETIRQNPGDDAPRLVYCDWLTEEGRDDESAKLRGHQAFLTDAQLIERAEAAGWRWVENEVLPTWGLSTGWDCDGKSFINAKPETKTKCLHAEQSAWGNKYTHLHFDNDLECCVCKRPIYLGWMESVEKPLIDLKECFYCNHWMGLIRGKNNIVIERDGERSHYQDGGRKTKHQFNGFGGTNFRIRFTDGRTLETCDLWHQGTIPERFYDLLPVNAEFVRDAK